MSETAETLGERLKAAREAKGLSAQKAADEMHLDAWVIEALESGDYVRIGPSVYVKGHLKRYAGLIGLPPSEILGADATRSSAPAAAATQPSTLRLRTSTPGGPLSRWVPLAGLAVAAVILAGVYWRTTWKPRMAALPINSQAPSEPVVASAASTAEDGALSAVANAEEADAGRIGDAGTGGAMTATAASGAVSAARGDADSIAGVGPARLRLSFSADSWVDVHDAAGRRLFAGNGRANSVKTIAGAAPMKVYLGFASGVQLEVNNHAVAIGPQFVAGDVARFEAGADGVLRRDAHAATASNPHPRG
ncbi:MAG: helix-turn-helix domain-containing protein [Steroidobacteraceae bacterium]